MIKQAKGTMLDFVFHFTLKCVYCVLNRFMVCIGMGVSRVLRGHFLCTGWMFLMRLPPAWYAGYLILLTSQPYS